MKTSSTPTLFLRLSLLWLSIPGFAVAQQGFSLPPRGYVIPGNGAPPPNYAPRIPAQNPNQYRPAPPPQQRPAAQPVRRAIIVKESPPPSKAKSSTKSLASSSKKKEESTAAKQTSSKKVVAKTSTNKEKSVPTASTKKADIPSSKSVAKTPSSSKSSTAGKTVAANPSTKSELGVDPRSLHPLSKSGEKAQAPVGTTYAAEQPKSGSAAFNTPGYEIDLTGFPPPVINVTPEPTAEATVATVTKTAAPEPAAPEKPAATSTIAPAPTEPPVLAAKIPDKTASTSVAEPAPAAKESTSHSAEPVETVAAEPKKASRDVESSILLDRSQLALPPLVTSLPAVLEVPKMAEPETIAATDFANAKPTKPNLTDLMNSGAKKSEIEKAIAPRAKTVEDLPIEEIAVEFPPAQLLPPVDALASEEPESPENTRPLPAPPSLTAKHSADKARIDEGNIVKLVGKRTTESPSQFIPTTPEFEPIESASEPSMDPEMGPLSIDADRVESHNDSGRFVFSGNVDMVCKKFRLRANKIVANRSASGGGMEKVDAEGDVTLRMTNENGQSFTCTGKRAIYDPVKETILLSGWPRIDEGARALVATAAGTQFTIDTKTGRLSSDGATKTLLK